MQDALKATVVSWLHPTGLSKEERANIISQVLRALPRLIELIKKQESALNAQRIL